MALAGGIRRYNPALNRIGGGGGAAPTATALQTQRAGQYGAQQPPQPKPAVNAGPMVSTRVPNAPAAQPGQVRSAGGGTPMMQVPQPAPMLGQQNLYGTQGQSSMPANPQFNPYQGQNIPQMPISQEMRNTFADYQFMPSVGNQARNMENPSDAYNWALRGANQNLQGYFGGQDAGGPFGGIGQNLLMNPPQAGQQPNAPNLMGPTNQNPNYQAQFGYNQFGGNQFDPNSVQGPNVSQVSGPNRSDFQGPNVPGLQELIGMGGGLQGAANVPREQLGRSGFEQSQIFGNPNAVSTQGFQSALTGAQGQAGADINRGLLDEQLTAIGAQQQQGLQDALRQAQRSTLRQGIADPGSTEANIQVGQEVGRVLPEFQKQMADARLNAANTAIQQQQFGVGQLGNLGASAANAAQGYGGLLQGEQQGLNELNVGQRGQDVDLARLQGQLGGQNMSGIADLIRAQTGAFEAGTGRGGTIGNLDIEAQRANQQAGLEGYRGQTERMGTLGDFANTGRGIGVDEFRAGTERGLGEEQARNAAAQLGYNYDQMNAEQRNQFNQRLNEQYQTGAGMYGDQLRNQADIYGTQMQGASNFYRDTQTGQTDRARLATDLLNGSVQAQQAFNEMIQSGNTADLNALLQMVMGYREGFINRANAREGARSNAWGGALSGLGSIASAGIGSSGGGGGR